MAQRKTKDKVFYIGYKENHKSKELKVGKYSEGMRVEHANNIRMSVISNLRLGTDMPDKKNRAVIHTLRHTFASQLAINGTPIFTIQKLLNHRDIKQTMRYAKLAPDSGMDMVQSIM